jgi:Spy/CpxP family protein refolding chaperone
MRTLILAMSLCAFTLMAQPPADRGPRTPEALKTALNLTDQQVTQMQEIQRQRFEASRDLRQQVQAKAKELREAVQSGGSNATAIGQLVLDTQALRKQIQEQDVRFRDQLQAVLDAEQKQKLAELQAAADLMPAVGQARMFGLLERPEGAEEGIGFRGGRRGPGMMGPGPAGPGAGPLGRGFRR